MRYRVIITDPALGMMLRQARYISEERESPEGAKAWLGRIFDCADALAEMPRRCPLAIEDAGRDYEIRAQIVGDYLMLFTIVEEASTVWILGFRHGAQQSGLEQLPEQPPGDTS